MTGGLLKVIFALGIGTWLFSIIENIAVHSFSSFFFRIGIPVYRQTIDLPLGFKTTEPNNTIRMSEGKFKFTTDNQVFFLSQIHWFKMFRLKTPFPLKTTGTITTDNQMNIVARLPIGTTLVFFLFITILTVTLIGSSIRSGNFSGIVFGLFPLVFYGVLFSFGYSTEMNRLKVMIREVQEIINEQNLARLSHSDLNTEVVYL